MFNKDLYKQLKAWEKIGYVGDRLKELATERGHNEKDITDTLRFFEVEEKGSFPANIGKGKLAAMIAICRTTTFIGLLHLIFLWKSKEYRSVAITALAASLSLFLFLIGAWPYVAGLISTTPFLNLFFYLLWSPPSDDLILIQLMLLMFFYLFLSIVMTVYAVKAYNQSKRLRIKILNEEKKNMSHNES